MVNYARIKDIDELLRTGEDRHKIGDVFQRFMQFVCYEAFKKDKITEDLQPYVIRHLSMYSMELLYYMYFFIN